MSLINPKNFIVPLQNKFNVGLIIVIAVLIAAMRLSGGRVTVESDSPRARARPASVAASSDKPARAASDSSRANRPAPAPAQNDELLDQLLASEPVPAKRADPRNVGSQKKTGEFNDIRKSLGLE